MSEWLAVEAIVRQRDKEIMAANLAKLSQESQDGHIPLMRKDSSLSNDVFESVDSDDGYVPPDPLPEESSSATTPTTEPSTPRLKCDPQHEYVTRVVKGKESDSTVSTASPDEGLGDSIARQSSLEADSKRSDSCDTDKNEDGLKSEYDDLLTVDRNIIVTNPSVDSGSGGEPETADQEDGQELLTTTLEDLGQKQMHQHQCSHSKNHVFLVLKIKFEDVLLKTSPN